MDTFDDEYNARSLMQIAREEAKEAMSKSRIQDAYEKTIRFTLKMCIPLIYCGILGEMRGDETQRLVNEWSYGVLPYMLALWCAKETIDMATPRCLESIVDDKLDSYRSYVSQSEKPQKALLLAGIGTSAIAGIYVACSAITEFVSNMDISQYDLAIVGVCVGLTHAVTEILNSTKAHQKILKRADRIRFEEMLDSV